MVSRQRIRDLYYGDKKPMSRKYLAIGAAALLVLVIIYFATTSSNAPSTTPTTLPVEEVDFDLELAAIKAKLQQAANNVDTMQQPSGFETQIDAMLASIE